MSARSAGYSGTPLPRKLGIRPGHRVLLVAAPPGFRLGQGGDDGDDGDDGTEVSGGTRVNGATVQTRAGREPYDVVLAFVRNRRDLERRLPTLRARLTEAGALWLAWPKRASGVATDLTENVLRDVLLPTGMVDTKVCAIDETWSGLRFVLRLTHRKG